MAINLDKEKLFYPILIFAVWLVTYIICQFIFPHMLGWDEMAYLSVARGIAEDFDFDGRSYTVMGLLKYGYPSNLINFPIYPIYLALFFKLFGVSQKIAYFATWLAALGVCILIYFIFLKLVPNKRKTALVVSLSYLFFPSVLKNCDTAMMEQAGCFLLCLTTFVLIKEFEKGRWNYFSILQISFLMLILWLYKTLFVGIMLGIFIFIVLAYKIGHMDTSIKGRLPLPVFLVSSYGIFAVLFYIAKKYIFYPVAPMVNFHVSQESKQVYADFLGGLFNNFPEHIVSNVSAFLKVTLGSYFLYPSTNKAYTGELAVYQQSILALSAYYFLIGIYLFLLLFIVILIFASWKQLSPLVKIFLCYSMGSIILFNLVLMIVFKVYHENFWRYNTYYLPFFVCSIGIVSITISQYFQSFIKEHPRVSKSIVSLVFVCIYIPLFISTIDQYTIYETQFHTRAKINADLIRHFLNGAKPRFIYFNDGIHTHFVDYPTRQIFKDATNEQLLKANTILPEPIEYLFLRQFDWLYQINKEQILKGEPILNGLYKEYGYAGDRVVEVYKYVGQRSEVRDQRSELGGQRSELGGQSSNL